MPLLRGLRDASRPSAARGRLGMCLHVEARRRLSSRCSAQVGGARVTAARRRPTTGSPPISLADPGIRMSRGRPTRWSTTTSTSPACSRRCPTSCSTTARPHRGHCAASTLESSRRRRDDLGAPPHARRAGRQGRVSVVVHHDSPIKLLFENEHGIGPAVVDVLEGDERARRGEDVHGRGIGRAAAASHARSAASVRA
jgi:hypothetical protein